MTLHSASRSLYIKVRAFLRIFLFLGIIGSFLVVSFYHHLTIKDPLARRRRFALNTTIATRVILKSFNIHVTTRGLPTHEQPFLLVSNHMGFLDILMLASHFPMNFVTSQEMRETPFLGLLTEMGGCIYVERRNRTKILGELHEIAQALKEGFRITLYPEATSHNGECVLPFKRTLIMAAAHAEVPIQPVVVNYRRINGDSFNMKWRDSVCWYGDITFAKGLWRALHISKVEAEIDFLPTVFVTPEEDRGVVADRLHHLISEKFVPVKAHS